LHWLSATVFVARQAFDAALAELRAGCEGQDAPRSETGGVSAVGLHLLHGLVLAAKGSEEAACDELARELAREGDRHVYSRECCANAWYALGALHLRRGRYAEVATAFQQALARVPGHAYAMVGLASLAPNAVASASLPASAATESVAGRPGTSAIDVALVAAADLTARGRHEDAARLCVEALTRGEPGAAGWLLPVEPLLNVSARRDVWAAALALVRQRAT
jgi:hypothetical protein